MYSLFLTAQLAERRFHVLRLFLRHFRLFSSYRFLKLYKFTWVLNSQHMCAPDHSNCGASVVLAGVANFTPAWELSGLADAILFGWLGGHL